MLISGCGSDAQVVAPPDPAAELIASGWSQYESGAVDSAAACFRLAIAVEPGAPRREAWEGLGWALLGAAPPESALVAFDNAAGTPSGAPRVQLDAGRAFAARLVTPPLHALAIVSADAVLTAEPRYVFAHDAGIDWRDLRLLLAQSRFAVGAWSEAAADVDSLGGNPPDPASPDFVAELLVEIQRLGLASR